MGLVGGGQLDHLRLRLQWLYLLWFSCSKIRSFHAPFFIHESLTMAHSLEIIALVLQWIIFNLLII